MKESPPKLDQWLFAFIIIYITPIVYADISVYLFAAYSHWTYWIFCFIVLIIITLLYLLWHLHFPPGNNKVRPVSSFSCAAYRTPKIIQKQLIKSPKLFSQNSTPSFDGLLCNSHTESAERKCPQERHRRRQQWWHSRLQLWQRQKEDRSRTIINRTSLCVCVCVCVCVSGREREGERER